MKIPFPSLQGFPALKESPCPEARSVLAWARRLLESGETFEGGKWNFQISFKRSILGKLHSSSSAAKVFPSRVEDNHSHLTFWLTPAHSRALAPGNSPLLPFWVSGARGVGVWELGMVTQMVTQPDQRVLSEDSKQNGMTGSTLAIISHEESVGVSEGVSLSFTFALSH